jgi:hypothetical protein
MEKQYKAIDYFRIDAILTEVEKMVRDLICESTHDIHTLIVGADLTGIEAIR